ncbi:hypothetical protein [Geminocystis sp. NIES-3709]|uniref:hypothetical protein n=1 Tax=Geminocystis sp. NIES-3709 TaxID=1617448 RepID=UPI0005FCD50E|nr:hypothetical protein [Geminocystis sp. NIES-3709]BAQ63361.1 hypothetical protein GM3709_126 [Geminocystis sp. NIES-3709]
MIETDFFTDEEIKEIILESCTEKIQDVVQFDTKNIYFLCIKEGYEGIFMKKKIKDSYYIPLLDIRNVIKEITIEQQKVKIVLQDEEFFTVAMPSEDIHLTFRRFKLIYEGLEKTQKTKYSEEEIEKYNIALQEQTKKNKKLNFKKLFGTDKKINKPRLIFLSCCTVILGSYALYNFIISRKSTELKYKITGLELNSFPYQNGNSIYNNGLKDEKKCESFMNNKEKYLECLKSLTSNIYYYKRPIKNIKYDASSGIFSFDCNLSSANVSSSIRDIDIKIDDYGGGGYRSVDGKISKVLSPEEAEIFKKRLIDNGQCSYILSGIKKSYFNTEEGSKGKVVIPVNLDLYIWFNDDLSILYYQEESNY